MIDFAPRFRRLPRMPAIRVSPALARESFALPVAVIALSCIAVFAILGALLPNERFRSTGFATPDYASHLSDLSGAPYASQLPTVWSMSPTNSALSRHARSVRVGARIVDLEVAMRARDMLSSAALVNRNAHAIAARNEQSAVAARFAGDIASMLSNAHGLRYLADDFRRIQRAASDVSALGAEVRYARRVAVADDAAFLLLGDWLEAGRIAVARGDRAFFGTRESVGEAESLERSSIDGPRSRAALEEVAALARGGRAGNLEVLARALDTALAALASDR